MKPEVVWEGPYFSNYRASNVLVNDNKYWVAEKGKTIGQGFKIKLDQCKRWINGIHVKSGVPSGLFYTTKFRVSVSDTENGSYKKLLEENLAYHHPSPLFQFPFAMAVETQFVKFELMGYEGLGGALFYFAALVGTSKF